MGAKEAEMAEKDKRQKWQKKHGEPAGLTNNLLRIPDGYDVQKWEDGKWVPFLHATPTRIKISAL